MVVDVDRELASLNERLRKVVEGMNVLKEAGIDEEILQIYICYKTKLSKKQVNLVLKSHEEFYEKLVKKMAMKKLKE